MAVPSGFNPDQARAKIGDIDHLIPILDRVIGEIDNVTPALDQQRQNRAANGRQLRATWTGPYAKEFDVDVLRMWNQGGDVAGKLARLRAKLEDGKANANAMKASLLRQIADYNASKSPHPTPGPSPMPVH
jgi:uncharacterized protein YukE